MPRWLYSFLAEFYLVAHRLYIQSARHVLNDRVASDSLTSSRRQDEKAGVQVNLNTGAILKHKLSTEERPDDER